MPGEQVGHSPVISAACRRETPPRSRDTLPAILADFCFGPHVTATAPYVAVPESFASPPGMNFGGTSGVAFNAKGNIFVIHRGPLPLME